MRTAPRLSALLFPVASQTIFRCHRKQYFEAIANRLATPSHSGLRHHRKQACDIIANRLANHRIQACNLSHSGLQPNRKQGCVHLFVHLVQFLIIRNNIPAIVTTILCLPYCVWAFIEAQVCFTLPETLLWTITGSVVAGANLLFIHNIAPKVWHLIRGHHLSDSRLR